MDSMANTAAVRQVFQAVNERDWSVLSSRVAPGFVRHDYGGVSFEGHGPEGLASFFGLLLSALPDLKLEVREIIATGDRAVVYQTACGTHLGEFLGLEPTGNGVCIDSVDLYRLEGGQIAESWPLPDLAAIRRAMEGV